MRQLRRGLLCLAVFLPMPATAQLMHEARAGIEREQGPPPSSVGEPFVTRVIVSTMTGTLVLIPLAGGVIYSTEREPMIAAGAIYLSMVVLTASAVTNGQSRCSYEERLQRSFVGGLVGLGVASVMFQAIHGTYMKGWGAAIQVSGVLLATPVGAALGAGRCDQDRRLR